jgi:hypothetical protein
MKKGMTVIGACITLSFLVFVGAVSTSSGKEVNKVPTGITNQAPQKQQPLAVESTVPKAAFWDLAVDHFVVAGQSFPFPNDFNQAKIINVKVGQTISCQCFYKVKTLTSGEITKADASRWGSGNLGYTIAGGLFFSGPPSHQEYKTEARNLPAFTYADVQLWKSQIGAAGKKEWTESMVYNWTATSEHVGKAVYLHFDVDSFLNINETDEQNNGSYSSKGIVVKFVVSP